jgi:hypothetical protein
VSAASPGSAPAREGKAQPTLRADLPPAHSPAEALALVVKLVSFHASNLPALRLFSFRFLRGLGPRLAGAAGAPLKP